MSAEERFWNYVEKSDGCWPWKGYIDRAGYGRFGLNAKNTLAHRFAYRLLIGPIPDDKELDHLCRNRRCVNPAHLEAVCRRVNVLRGVSPAAHHAKKTRCIRGHEFTADNIYWGPKGARHCKTCALWRRHRHA